MVVVVVPRIDPKSVVVNVAKRIVLCGPFWSSDDDDDDDKTEFFFFLCKLLMKKLR